MASPCEMQLASILTDEDSDCPRGGTDTSDEQRTCSLSTVTTPITTMINRRGPPEKRGELRKSRSLLVEMEINSTTTSSPRSSLISDEGIKSNSDYKPLPLLPPPPSPMRRKSGTLTFARSIGELKRAGSSRDVGPVSPKPTRRKAPIRSRSCVPG